MTLRKSNAVVDLNILPDIASLKQLCKALATLDAIIYRAWDGRYYSYNKNLAPNEECFSMRDGSGDEFFILFSAAGVVINGFAHESTMSRWSARIVPPVTFKEKIAAFFGEKKTKLEQQIFPGVVDTFTGGVS